MNKTGKVLTTAVVVAAVGAGAYFLIGPKGVIGPGGETDDAIKQKTDSVNFVLTKQLNDLEIAAGNTEFNTQKLDSLAKVLEDVKWQPVKNGGDYEKKSKEIYLDAKRKVAKALASAYDRNRVAETERPALLQNIDNINE